MTQGQSICRVLIRSLSLLPLDPIGVVVRPVASHLHLDLLTYLDSHLQLEVTLPLPAGERKQKNPVLIIQGACGHVG